MQVFYHPAGMHLKPSINEALPDEALIDTLPTSAPPFIQIHRSTA
jgi:hypothetical protein